jgi:hypothetical protein
MEGAPGPGGRLTISKGTIRPPTEELAISIRINTVVGLGASLCAAAAITLELSTLAQQFARMPPAGAQQPWPSATRTQWQNAAHGADPYAINTASRRATQPRRIPAL